MTHRVGRAAGRASIYCSLSSIDHTDDNRVGLPRFDLDAYGLGPICDGERNGLARDVRDHIRLLSDSVPVAKFRLERLAMESVELFAEPLLKPSSAIPRCTSRLSGGESRVILRDSS